MKKFIVLTAVTSILILGGNQQAWARDGEQHDNDDYRAFRKIVRILNAVINDDHHRRGGTRVIVRTERYPRKVCRIRGRRKIFYQKDHGYHHRKHARYDNWGHYKKRHYNRR